MSSKVVTAEYDATEKVLRLVKPLEGIADHAQVNVIVEEPARAPHPWDQLRKSVSKEQIDELASIIDEMFPIEK